MLIVKLSSLGDVVHAMPVVHDILAAHPHALIDWVVEPGFAPLLRRVDGVNEVIECALRRWSKAWWTRAVRGEWRAFRQQLLDTAKFPGAKEIITIDGLRVDYKDGFGLIRSSNTTPVLVLRFEGHTPQALARIQAHFMAALRVVKPDARIAAAAH